MIMYCYNEASTFVEVICEIDSWLYSNLDLLINNMDLCFSHIILILMLTFTYFHSVDVFYKNEQPMKEIQR
mgnify:CR=1 FL=1